MIEAKWLDIPKGLPLKNNPSGHRAFLVHRSVLTEFLRDTYGRPGLCLKVFKRPACESLEDFCWGPGDIITRQLVEKVKIQNLYAMCDMAPRVYDVVRVEWDGIERFAQVTDFVPGRLKVLPTKPATLLRDCFEVELNRWDSSSQSSNFIEGQLIDFESLAFVQKGYDLTQPVKERLCFFDHGEEYKNRLVKRAYRGRRRAYHPVPEMGIVGRRDLKHRTSRMRLDEVDFQGKTVLDLGCALGAFSRMAHDRGARRVVGVDSLTGSLAAEVANWLGYWNLDFLEFSITRPYEDNDTKIRELSGIESFDVVFLLAMIRRVGGWAPWLSGLCKDILYVESHATRDSEQKAKELTEMLEQEFSEVKYLGTVTDDRTRVLLRCRR